MINDYDKWHLESAILQEENPYLLMMGFYGSVSITPQSSGNGLRPTSGCCWSSSGWDSLNPMRNFSQRGDGKSVITSHIHRWPSWLQQDPKRFFPRCIAAGDIRCDVDEDLWTDRNVRKTAQKYLQTSFPEDICPVVTFLLLSFCYMAFQSFFCVFFSAITPYNASPPSDRDSQLFML